MLAPAMDQHAALLRRQVLPPSTPPLGLCASALFPASGVLSQQRHCTRTEAMKPGRPRVRLQRASAWRPGANERAGRSFTYTLSSSTFTTSLIRRWRWREQ